MASQPILWLVAVLLIVGSNAQSGRQNPNTDRSIDSADSAMAELEGMMDIFSPEMQNTTAEKFEMAVEVMEYMMKYGYVSTDQTSSYLMRNLPAMTAGLKRLQDMANLSRNDGKVDMKLMAFLRLPRCGMRDFPEAELNNDDFPSRKKRYALQGSRWNRPQLSYRVTRFSANRNNRLTQTQVDQSVDQAFNMWSAVSNLRFRRTTSGIPDLDVSFAKRDHGDQSAFDGRGSVLAHATFPGRSRQSGDSHFDDEERWTLGENRGTNFLQVAVHEFGHALGLGHSTVQGAIMYPSYTGYVRNFRLHSDDIMGIQALYGARSTNRPRRRGSLVSGKQSSNAGLCDGTRFDTILSVENQTFVFKGTQVWELGDAGVVSQGYPMEAATIWPGLPSAPDAAVHVPLGNSSVVLFFKGDQIWSYDVTDIGFNLTGGYPAPFSAYSTLIPADLDAVGIYSRTGELFFFKGPQFWSFNVARLRASGPRQISTLRGIPAIGIDAVMTWRNGVTYFFKGNEYWRFNVFSGRTVSSLNGIPYPRKTSEVWFGCETQGPLMSMVEEEKMAAFMDMENVGAEEDAMSGVPEARTSSGGANIAVNFGMLISTYFGLLGARKIFSVSDV